MTEREALLRAVCEFPDDDTPRLVFADWLQEHGEEARAEFIRLQIERSRYAEDSPEYVALRDREEVIENEHRLRWLAEMPNEPGWYWYPTFVRGFIDELAVNSYAVETSDPAPAFAAAPIVMLTFSGQPITRWVPYLRRVRLLTFMSARVTDADARELCAPERGYRFDEIFVGPGCVDTFDPTVLDALVARFGRAVVGPNGRPVAG
jgi:uncharacterized protein (TIGR02996 family)